MIDRNLVAALLTWCLAVLAGCGQAEVEPVSAVSAYPPTYSGQTSIEERIINADVVARVRMVSVEGGVVDGYYSGFANSAHPRHEVQVPGAGVPEGQRRQRDSRRCAGTRQRLRNGG